MPRNAPWLSRWSFLANARDRVPGLAKLSEVLTGLSAERSLPRWRRDAFSGQAEIPVIDGVEEVALFADTFNRWFEPENLRAAIKVLQVAGTKVTVLEAAGERPLCCGRTYLASGMIEEARSEAQRLLAAAQPFVERNVPIVGLEPSCVLGLRDELRLLLPGEAADSVGRLAMTFEEYLDQRADNGLDLDLQPSRYRRALVHGHCHQKAFDVMPSVMRVLRLVPELDVEMIPSSCCGMAGAFGYQAETLAVSKKMAEASLLPAVRAAEDDTIVVADGTSCRHQIADLADRNTVHVAAVLAGCLPA